MHKVCVTLWHMEDDGSFTRTVFENCFVSLVSELEVYASEQTYKNTLRVRIYQRISCAISTGDRLCIGNVTDKRPPKKAYIISRFKKNFGVSAKARHYRIDCV